MGRYQYKALLHGLAFRQVERTPTIESFLDEIAGPFGVRGRAVRSAVLSMATTAILVGGIGIGLWYFTRPDPDRQLERRIEESAIAQWEQARSGGAAQDEMDPELLKVLLEQGNDYLGMARKSFDPGVLSEGVSSALGAFQEVLRIDPKNKQAITGIVEIVHLYEAEIGRLAAAGDDARVVELAGHARRIDPNRTSLEEFERTARARLNPAAVEAK
jgi:protein-tyrosine-phosphatase